ncbi:MAG: FAD-dependent oxidoreductase, partial [Deltaproteobacteria bacterium]
MTCDRCARAVDTAVGNVAGVVASHTRAADGVARVVAAPGVSPDAIAAAVRAAGYTVVSVSRAADGDDDDAGDAPLDLLIVGAGSAGFAAAIRARELGARVALVERGALGGTCVNVGCVPSKTLIRAAEVVHRALHHGFAGIRFAPPALDFRAVIEDKRHLVAELQQAKYWDVLAAHPDIRLLRGTARLRADGGVDVDGRPVPARNVLIATGSHPHVPAIRGLADAETVTSTELMDLDERPDRLVVLGGGYVGLELGQTFARFGSRVTVLARSRLLSREEPALGAALADYL